MTPEPVEQFMREYRVSHKNAVFGGNVVAMKCTCEDGGGPTHWAAIRNTPEAIENHIEHEKCLADLRAMEIPDAQSLRPS